LSATSGTPTEVYKKNKKKNKIKNNNSNNNNSNYDNVYGAIVMTKGIARVHPVYYFDKCRLSAGWPPTPRPSQLTWAVNPPKIGLLPTHRAHRADINAERDACW